MELGEDADASGLRVNGRSLFVNGWYESGQPSQTLSRAHDAGSDRIALETTVARLRGAAPGAIDLYSVAPAAPPDLPRKIVQKGRRQS